MITDIDVRTTNGLLYGQSNLGRLYQLDPFGALAIPLGGPIPITSTTVGFDFDPRADLIRILGNQRENIVREANFGLFVRAANTLTYQTGDFSEGFAPRITGAAFFNNVPNPSFRLLYAIDHARNALVRVGSATVDDGLLTTIGGLGRDVTSRVGLDIAPVTNVMFASLQTAGQAASRLFQISYATGRAIPVGLIGNGLLVNDIAVDLRGISGFNSRAGFGVFAPPGGFVGFTSFNFPSFISPSGTAITATPTSPFLIGSTGSRFTF